MKFCNIIKFAIGLTLIGMALYVIISGILNKEDGNLLVSSVLFLMLLTGIFLIYRSIHRRSP